MRLNQKILEFKDVFVAAHTIIATPHILNTALYLEPSHTWNYLTTKKKCKQILTNYDCRDKPLRADELLELIKVFHCTAGFRHHMQDCIYFLTSNDVNLPIERCRRVVSPRPEHGCHSNPPPLSCDVLPGLCGRPGVGIRTSRAPCQTDRSTLSNVWQRCAFLTKETSEFCSKSSTCSSSCSWGFCVLKGCIRITYLWHTHHCSRRPWSNPTCLGWGNLGAHATVLQGNRKGSSCLSITQREN